MKRFYFTLPLPACTVAFDAFSLSKIGNEVQKEGDILRSGRGIESCCQILRKAVCVEGVHVLQNGDFLSLSLYLCIVWENQGRQMGFHGRLLQDNKQAVLAPR